jgi:hypothetical protein
MVVLSSNEVFLFDMNLSALLVKLQESKSEHSGVTRMDHGEYAE